LGPTRAITVSVGEEVVVPPLGAPAALEEEAFGALVEEEAEDAEAEEAEEAARWPADGTARADEPGRD
jgi:hypothetical protein